MIFMNEIIFLLQKESDYSKFQGELKNYVSPKIFSLDYESHIYLENNHISHEIADNLLSENDLKQIDDFTSYFIQNWIPQKLQKNFSVNNIFLPNLIEHELFVYLLPIFSISITLKKIIDKEKPSKIIDFTEFNQFTETLIKNKNNIIKFSPIEKKSFYHDKVSVNFSLMNKPLHLEISKNTFLKIKQITSNLTDKFLDANIKQITKKSILLVNFDPIQYETLFKELKKQEIDVILYNPRKPAITNLKSFNIVKNSKCKIFNTYDIEKLLHTEIQIHQKNIKETIELLFSETDHFENLFKSFDSQFWKSIKVPLKKICITKFHDSIKNILVLTNFFNSYDISLILQWAEVGQEEKECMYVGKSFNIKSFMLQHGRFLTHKKWTKISNFTGHFPQKRISDGQFVWGKFTKEFGSSQGYENKNIILSGSPKHDKFFNSTRKLFQSNKILLATTGAMCLTADTCTTNSQLKYDKFIHEIYNIIKKIPDKELSVRSHPSPILTENAKNLIKNIDPKLQLSNNINLLKLIQDSELVITFNNSTICLDALALNKPVISLQTDDWSLDEEIVRNDGVFSINNIEDCEIYIKKILFDDNFRKTVLENSKLFLDDYLVNQGNASKSLAKSIFNLI